MNRRWVRWLATGFGLGYLPWAPGTFGTLPGVALVLLLRSTCGWGEWAPVVALVAALGAVPVCTSAEHMFGQRDDRRIVADEYLTFPIAVLGLPLEQHPVGWLLGAFVLVRLLDIVKPWPARPLERCPGGWGIVLDDVVAASYACALLHGITRGLLPLVRGG